MRNTKFSRSGHGSSIPKGIVQENQAEMVENLTLLFVGYMSLGSYF